MSSSGTTTNSPACDRASQGQGADGTALEPQNPAGLSMVGAGDGHHPRLHTAGGLPPVLAQELGVPEAALTKLFCAGVQTEYEQPTWMVVNLQVWESPSQSKVQACCGGDDEGLDLKT
jgi:hypothetical protein